MKTAVVILNWNGRKLLEQFLPGVVLHSLSEAEVYVIDNASTDDSVAFINSCFPEVKVIQNPENKGYAGGYNAGLKQVDAEVYVLLNSDVEVTAGWLSPVVKAFKTHPRLAAAQPKILDYHNRDSFEYAGAAGGFIDKYGYPFCRGRIFNTLEKDEGQYDGLVEIFWASGACFFVRSSCFWEAGGFDEDYFAHQEEIDLCWWFFNTDYKVYCVGDSRVYHVGGGTLDAQSPKKTYLNFRNSLFNLQKHLPGDELFKSLFIRMLLDGLAGVQFLITFKVGHFFSILRAHFSFYTFLSKTSKKRGKLLKKKNFYKIHSIVFAYFVKKIKKFNAL